MEPGLYQNNKGRTREQIQEVLRFASGDPEDGQFTTTTTFQTWANIQTLRRLRGSKTFEEYEPSIVHGYLSNFARDEEA